MTSKAPDQIDPRPPWLDPTFEPEPRNRRPDSKTPVPTNAEPQGAESGPGHTKRADKRPYKVTRDNYSSKESEGRHTPHTSSSREQHRRQIVETVAIQAMHELRYLSPEEVKARYGRLNLAAVEGIAKGAIDPLTFLAYGKDGEHIYSLPNQSLSNFFNLGIQLYHFTAVTNVQPIKRDGILPLSLLRERGKAITHVSDDLSRRIDAYRGLNNFVHLAFTREAAMAYVAQRRSAAPLAWFQVSPNQLLRSEAFYCRDYANKTGAEMLPISNLTDLDLIALVTGFSRIGYWQVLIRGAIAPEFITHISETPAQSYGAYYGSETDISVPF